MTNKELKRAAGLKPYERRLLELRKSGREFKARCPWHDDTNPSLSLFERDGEWFFKCFVCDGRKGDVIEFVKQKDNLDFRTALETIAAECNVVVKNEPQAKFEFKQEVATGRLGEAADYLASRGISLGLAKESGLGVVDFPGLGTTLAIPYDKAYDVVKFRALHPEDKGNKFRHLPGRPSHELLYGIDDVDFLLDPEVFITESELDALTLQAHGFAAVSVSSATTSVGSDGNLKILSEHLEKLESAERIFLALDQDNAGLKCASAFERLLPSYKTFRLTWEYGGKDSDDPKDIGELYAKSPHQFHGRIEELRQEAINRPPKWRLLFKAPSEMEQGEMKFLIDKFLPEGVTFIGGLSSVGKTWFALSLAKALTTGRNFLGLYPVPEPVHVIYLIPESGERSFHGRLMRMGISDKFLSQTMNSGVPLALDDSDLLAAVRALKPVIVLDTAVRFLNGDENSASENARGLAKGIFGLLQAGARGVVGLHHSPKGTNKKVEPTLESTLRGTGDFGAMCDAVYSLKSVDDKTFEIRVQCTKARDFEAIQPFHIQGRPYIDKTGDFGLLTKPSKTVDKEVEALITAINANQKATYRELQHVTGIPQSRVKTVAAKAGLIKAGDVWMPTQQESVPILVQ
ncbi:MAG TPA: CHC2 zinc finger domain-containing protein [Terriglobales bacterium]|jgi:hypothetical protein|nr:CHC2 zinc finger domain-containing protein [Terriglobales bacterium]